MKKFLTILALMALAAQVPAVAQYTRGMSRHYKHSGRSYADLVEVDVREPGTLERQMPAATYDRVRLLRVSGPLNEKDLDYITKLAKRGKVLNDEGKSIDNYLDVDLERAEVIEKYGSRYNHDVLPRRAFQYASRLRAIVLPERLKSIGDHAFASCYDLEEVIMPPRVYELGEGAFDGCSNLKYFAVPNRLETIGRRCFKGCTSLTRFDMPSDVRHIGSEAFDNCRLAELYIPAYCEIEDDNPGFMPQLQNIEVEPGNNHYCSIDRALYDRDATTLIMVPTALNGTCRVADGVQAIADRAFYKCRVTDVQLPNTVIHLGQAAFQGCSRLASIWLPDGVTQIPPYAFHECSALKSIDMGPVSLMGEHAFSECAQLQDINLDGTLPAIAPSAFERCRALRQISLPPMVKIIDEKAFHECTALRSVLLSDQLARIGRQAFDRCTSLEQIALPEAVVIIDEKAFYECTAMSHVQLNERLQHIGKEAFRRCKQLTAVALPAHVTEVEKEAFRECTALAEITLNYGLKRLGDNALRETAITRLVLPATMQHMGKKVAEKCKQLMRIECHALTPPELDNVSNDKIELVVPAQALERYKDTKSWKKFKVIKPL